MSELLLLKKFSDHIHAARVTYENHLVCKLFRFKVNVEN